MFIKHKEGKVTTLIVYVDDMVLTEDDPCEMKALQEYLATKFKIKISDNLNISWGLRLLDRNTGFSSHNGNMC